MDKTLKILMVGSDLSVKGGMTSVVKAFLNHDFKDQIDIMYIPTHIEGVANIKKIVFFMHSILNIISALLKEDISIVHIHMSEKGSFYRKFIIYLIMLHCNHCIQSGTIGPLFICMEQNSKNILTRETL